MNMQEQQAVSYLSGGNSSYLEELYESYLKDPQSVSQSWRNYFSQLTPDKQDVSLENVRNYFRSLAQNKTSSVPVAGDVVHERKQAQVVKLINAYRKDGHFQAKLDPLEFAKTRRMPELEISFYNLSRTDDETNFSSDNLFPNATPLKKILATLEEIYCKTIGYEYFYLSDQPQVEWLRKRIENQQGKFSFDPETKLRLLQRLLEAEGLEKFLGAKYVGQTRFSLEGGDSFIVILDEIVQRAGKFGAQELIFGMAHRGRLNVLINILGKSSGEVCREFEGKTNNHKWSGDVKYHMGFASNVETPNGTMHLALAFNPSHLEIIDPVMEGSVRARQDQRNDAERTQVVPILIHGDASFAGQGVVMETFALSQTRGYGTGGTVHIVINNQVGFTTSNPKDARSSWYCTDLAKMVEAPIIHVNADDIEAVLFVTQLALDFRMTFKKDVVIDLVCYRRLGHNEGDEPSATQPLMYQIIKQHPTTFKLYADKLISEKIIGEQEINVRIEEYRNKIEKGEAIVPTTKNRGPHAINWKPYTDKEWTTEAKSAVPIATLQKIANKLNTLPSNLTLQPQVAKIIADRLKMAAGEIPVDWGFAENMAYATLVAENYGVRITGQDVGRGTFAHRHAVLHDYKNGETYIPLQHVAEKQANFSIYDSILSEAAVLGFEYGYASSSPDTLVIWEAQYGDFVNGAQVVIDQFISSAEQKWGRRLCNLVMLLPHGYEGAGPEHSSARLERFLQLCAEQNMQVCVPSTAAQIFHLLRRQVVRKYRNPLIVLTPKGFLRLDLAKSSLQELATGKFQLVIPEADDIVVDKAKRVIFCSGKVYYDLLKRRRETKQQDVALIRVEQLYPFPEAEVTEQLKKYKKAKDIVWCQEEPRNQGAWYSIQHYFVACLGKEQTLRYAGRPASASTAAGYKALHTEQQDKLITEALG